MPESIDGSHANVDYELDALSFVHASPDPRHSANHSPPPPETASSTRLNASLFPKITSNQVPTQDFGSNWSDLSLRQTKSIVSIVDDAASSICLDEIDVPLKDVAKTIFSKSAPPPSIPQQLAIKIKSKNPSILTATSDIQQTVYSPGLDETQDDFEVYNRQTAAQVLTVNKLERKRKRQLRRRLRQQRKEQYFGNYFGDSNLECLNQDGIGSNLRVSYNVDNFLGQRQNENYNHQLNLMFSQAKNLKTNRNNLTQHGLTGSNMEGLHMVTSGASYLTDNIDDMSNDGRSSDDDRNPTTGNDQFSDSSDFSESDSDHDDTNEKWYPRQGLKRTLKARHLTSTAFAGAIGISSMLTMGQALYASGPLGSLLGFLIAGAIVFAVMTSYGEIVSFLPLHTGIPGTVARFVDPSMGIAIGATYWFLNAIALPLELTAAAMMLTEFKGLSEPGVVTVWIIVILVLVFLANVIPARIYGDFQYLVSGVRFLMVLGLIVTLIFINRGLVGPQHDNVGFRYWQKSKSNSDSGIIYGPFRPILPIHLLYKTNQDTTFIWGIPGSVGRFLQVAQGIIIAARAYMNSGMVFASVGEARNPRRAIASATEYIFFRILFFYVLTIFMFGLTIYAGDTNLMVLGTVEKYDEARVNDLKVGVMYSSTQAQHDLCLTGNYFSNKIIMGFDRVPWTVALQSAGQCAAAAGINAGFIVFAISAGSAHVYASSRTLYGLFRMFIEMQPRFRHRQKKWWQMPGWCNEFGVPMAAIMVSFPFAFLAFMTTHTSSFRVFDLLLNVSSSASMLVWAGMALTFLRFFKAVNGRKDLNDGHYPSVNRDGTEYPYRSRFQPYTAWVGLCGCIVLSISQGFFVFLNTNWNISDFIASYFSLFFCVTVYSVHKYFSGSRLVPASKLDLDTGRRELERAEWAEDRKYVQSYHEWIRSKWSLITGNRYHRRRRLKRVQASASTLAVDRGQGSSNILVRRQSSNYDNLTYATTLRTGE